MRSAHVVLVGLMVGCAHPPASPSTASSRPSPPSRPASPDPAPIIAVEDPACEEVAFPPIHSVIVVPAANVARALAPVVHAACMCSRSGDPLRITTIIVPEGGTVTAHAPENLAADACMTRAMAESGGRFAPFELHSDCIDCGPKRYGVFRGATPPPSPQSKIAYPFTLLHP